MKEQYALRSVIVRYIFVLPPAVGPVTGPGDRNAGVQVPRREAVETDMLRVFEYIKAGKLDFAGRKPLNHNTVNLCSQCFMRRIHYCLDAQYLPLLRCQF